MTASILARWRFPVRLGLLLAWSLVCAAPVYAQQHDQDLLDAARTGNLEQLRLALSNGANRVPFFAVSS